MRLFDISLLALLSHKQVMTCTCPLWHLWLAEFAFLFTHISHNKNTCLNTFLVPPEEFLPVLSCLAGGRSFWVCELCWFQCTPQMFDKLGIWGVWDQGQCLELFLFPELFLCQRFTQMLGLGFCNKILQCNKNIGVIHVACRYFWCCGWSVFDYCIAAVVMPICKAFL